MTYTKQLTLTVLFTTLTLGTLAGCASDRHGANVYTRGEMRSVQQVQEGTIVSVTPIKIKEDSNFTNTLVSIAGAAIGAIAGSNIGGGSGATVAGIIGGVGGGIAANAAVDKLQEANGIEITVRMDHDGQLYSIAQQGDPKNYYVGKKVKITRSGGKARVF